MIQLVAIFLLGTAIGLVMLGMWQQGRQRGGQGGQAQQPVESDSTRAP